MTAFRQHLRSLVPAPLRDWRRRTLERRAREPVILTRRSRSWDPEARTAVILCSPHFRESVPNAGVTCRLGLARGFEQVGLNFVLLSVFDLPRLRRLPEPIVFLSESDFAFLDETALAELRRHPHIAWVNPWFAREELFWQESGLEPLGMSEAREQVLRSEPPCLVGQCVEAGLEYFSGWTGPGRHVIPFPLACDTTLYDRGEGAARFPGIRVAFVGGYWPNKARSFDLYLRPYESELTVYGYSPWPYAGFGGQLPVEDEPYLYRDALLSPSINEPHVPVMHIDLNERVYKILGCGGLSITDVTPGYRQLFATEELLVPESLDEYHDMVRTALDHPERLAGYRERGYHAVRSRHTYAHRAAMLLEALNLPVPRKPEAEAAFSTPGVPSTARKAR